MVSHNLIPINNEIVRLNQLHLVDDPLIRSFFKDSERRVRFCRQFHRLPVMKFTNKAKGHLYCNIEEVKNWIRTGGKT